MSQPDPVIPQGIAGVEFKGPFSVGRYAAFLRDRFREIARVQLFGEVWNCRSSKTKLYFELRDGDGALPCSIWRSSFEALGLREDALKDGTQVVVAGGPDYYVGSRTASPSFSFAATSLRVAGEGDLLAQLEALRRALDEEGLFEPQKRLKLPALPRCIGVVTGEGGKARDDVLAALERRGWAGRLLWAFAPVQDRHAAPAVAERLTDLVAVGEAEVIIVARGGGSLADLFAFCDETLCRTVALLPIPVIASVGHHTDRMLIDDVAAVACSTPTHAAEAAVPLAPSTERDRITRLGLALQNHSGRAVLGRAQRLAALARGPAHHLERHQTALRQQVRELRAAGTRRIGAETVATGTRTQVLERKRGAASGAGIRDRRAQLGGLASALAGHDPARTLARGYAIVEDRDGELVTSAAAARAARSVALTFADGKTAAEIEDRP